MDNNLESIKLYAWLGEDEFGSGEIGLKQAAVPAGMIPMVATSEAKMNQGFIREAMDAQGKKFGKKIVLCRYRLEKVILEVGSTISKNVCPQCINIPDYIKEVKKEDIVVSCKHGRYWIKTDKFYTWNCRSQEKDDR